MKKTLIIALSIFSFLPLYGQQEAQFTQYNDNMMYYNPGYTGSREVLNLTGIHRQQWIGIDGAPMSTALFLHGPLKYESVGLGASFLNDKVGPVNSTWINGDFSYSFKFKRHRRKMRKLAFGLTGGINIINANFTNLVTGDPNDALAANNYRNQVNPNFGAGVYYHSKHWYAGVSVPKFVESKIELGRLPEQRHYYFMTGGYFKVNRMLKIRPSALFKMTKNAPFALEGSVAFIYYDRFWVGANYRLGASAGALVQYQANDQFKIGYSVDFSTSRLVKNNYGTHELMLSYDFLQRNKKSISPRFF